jgi:spermidine/putrescine transport system substrate-binding protein
MSKTITVLLLTFSLIAPVCSAQTLNILTWEAYFADEIVAQWEARTGANIKQIYFDTDEVRNSILLSADTNDIDIVTLDPITAGIVGKRDAFLPVDQYRDTPNIRHASPEWAQRCAPYATPYLWGTLGIAYRKDRVSNVPTSWRHLLNPQPELVGHIGLLENYIDTLAPALILRNVSVTTDDEAILREVFAEMKELLPSILTFDYAISYLNESPEADELYMALAYSGDQLELNLLSDSQQWEYVVPEEGSMIWSECLAVMRNSPNQTLALDFINFMNTPEIAAANSESLFIATTNAAALKLQSEALRNNPDFIPDTARRAKLNHYSPDISVKNILLRDRITSTLVQLHESQ